MNVQLGIDRLERETRLQEVITGRIGYLCHSASVNASLQHGLDIMIRIFGERVCCAFGPQHGFTTDLQDNMIETAHAIHPVYKIPVFSLYGETRQPTSDMLDLIDTLVIDLQDVGTRVYTYIWTMHLAMKACSELGIRVVVLDRPNPAGGIMMEGNLPLAEWFSFVCMSKIPRRHALTIGEMAILFNTTEPWSCDLQVISMLGWNREMLWKDTGLAWINPSPNLPTPDGTLVYPGSVLFEGTQISEGRGTTRSLEIFGHPDFEPFGMRSGLSRALHHAGLGGFHLRPLVFVPTFHKFAGKVCGGFQIHVSDANIFQPWKSALVILRYLYHQVGPESFWNQDPYEYQFDKLAFDWINAQPLIRHWIEDPKADLKQLSDLEKDGLNDFQYLASECKLY